MNKIEQSRGSGRIQDFDVVGLYAILTISCIFWFPAIYYWMKAKMMYTISRPLVLIRLAYLIDSLIY